jgi:hypothetical protein
MMWLTLLNFFHFSHSFRARDLRALRAPRVMMMTAVEGLLLEKER